MACTLVASSTAYTLSSTVTWDPCSPPGICAHRSLPGLSALTFYIARNLFIYVCLSQLEDGELQYLPGALSDLFTYDLWVLGT